jgi:hypothetical protein
MEVWKQIVGKGINQFNLLKNPKHIEMVKFTISKISKQKPKTKGFVKDQNLKPKTYIK